MNAARIHQWGGDLRLEEIDEPKPAEGEVLVRVLACGVGQTVLNYMRGDLGSDPHNLPRVPGHELVGRVVETGTGVDRARLGEYVAAYFYLFCGRCPKCLAAEEPLCEKLGGYLGVDRDGGYAPLATLPARNAISLPSGVDPVLATTIPDAIATAVHIARRAAITPGHRVAVIAAGGGVGIHMVQVARLFGAEVAGLDSAPEKLSYLQERFNVLPIDSTDFSVTRLPAGWAGADVIVDLLGTEAGLAWSLQNLCPGGRLVVLTTFRKVGVPLGPRDLVEGQLSVLGSRYASRAEVDLAARLVAGGRVSPVVSQRVALDGVESLHEKLRSGTLLGRGAVVWS